MRSGTERVDAYNFLMDRYGPQPEEEEEEIVYPVLGGGITGVVDLAEKINTEDYFQLQPVGQDRTTLLPGQEPPDQVHWGQSMPRYFYHKPPPDVREGSEDKGIKAYTPAHKEMTPFKEGVVWMSHSKPLTAGENVTSVTDERINPNDTNVRVIDVTKLERSNLHIANDGHLQHRGDVPFDAIVDIERASDKTEIGKNDSNYEMPKYDMSWDALEPHLETLATDNKLNFKPLTEDERLGPYRRFFEDTDNVNLAIGNSIYFGKSEEDIKDKLLKEYTSPEGKFFERYNPPRLTPRPDWSTDASDPFPEIPSDIKEIHLDDVPEYYRNHHFGEALEQWRDLRGLGRSFAEKYTLNSEPYMGLFESPPDHKPTL